MGEKRGIGQTGAQVGAVKTKPEAPVLGKATFNMGKQKETLKEQTASGAFPCVRDAR